MAQAYIKRPGAIPFILREEVQRFNEQNRPRRKSLMMKHYGVREWVDFARRVGALAEQVAMASHLEEGCDECGQLARFCQQLAGVASVMSRERVPEKVTRCARAIFPARQASGWKRAIRVPVELVYDSFLVPIPVGLRASWQVGWQAMYRAGDCSVDLRIDPDARSSRATLTGQVSSHVLPNRPMRDIPVCLRSGKRTVAETLSNQFGEFQLEYDQKGQLELCIELDGRSRRILAPLRRIARTDETGRGATLAGGNRKRSTKKN